MSAKPSTPPTVQIEITQNHKVSVVAPYDSEFVDAARTANGRYDRLSNTWTFPLRFEQRIRNVCQRVYGTDGTPGTTVDIEIALDTHPLFSDPTRWRKAFDGAVTQISLAGRVIVGFTSGGPVRLGAGVELVDGSLTAATATPCWEKGTVLEVRGIPEAFLPRIGSVGTTVVGRTIQLDEMRDTVARMTEQLLRLKAEILDAERRNAQPKPIPAGPWGIRTLREPNPKGIQRVLHHESCKQLAANRRFTSDQALELLALPDVSGCPYCKSEQRLTEGAQP